MAKIVAAITTSVDGYITGPNDGPDKGLGEGGERLHYWVFGGPGATRRGRRARPKARMPSTSTKGRSRAGAVVVGRNMYEAAGHWGEKNPFGMPVFVVTHRPEEEPPTGEFTFVGGFDEAIDRAKEAAGDKDVSIGGGADVIRQGLDAGIVDELHIIVAPVILGGGKRLFQDFTKSLDLENRRRTAVAVGDLHRVRGQALGPNASTSPHSQRGRRYSDRAVRFHDGVRRLCSRVPARRDPADVLRAASRRDDAPLARPRPSRVRVHGQSLAARHPRRLEPDLPAAPLAVGCGRSRRGRRLSHVLGRPPRMGTDS